MPGLTRLFAGHSRREAENAARVDDEDGVLQLEGTLRHLRPEVHLAARELHAIGRHVLEPEHEEMDIVSLLDAGAPAGRPPGAFGTSWWVDPKEQVVGVLLTQRRPDLLSIPAPTLDFWTSAYQLIDD